MDARSLRDLVVARADEYLAELETLVNIDSGSFSPRGVNAVADRCEQRFRSFGWDVERRAHAPGPGERQLGDLVIGRRRGDGGPRVLLVGHTEPCSTTARPRRVRSASRGHGPAVPACPT